MPETETTFPFKYYESNERLLSSWQRIGIPKPGNSLYEGSLVFLSQQELVLSPYFEKGKVLRLEQNNREVYKLRAKDMIQGLTEGCLDVGILGADKIFEEQLKGTPITPFYPLNFGDCAFAIGFPYNNCIPRSFGELKQVLETGIIATSLPKTLQFLLGSEGITISDEQIRLMAGSVEAAIRLYKVTAIADIVSSGDSTMANGIRPDYRLIQFPGAYLVKRKLDTNNLVL